MSTPYFLHVYDPIHHAGCGVIGHSESNGLSLHAVGSSTVIENIEIFATSDDGVEFLGGNVNTKYISVAYCGDDAFDIDEGYQGKNQFWFSIEQSYEGDRSGEFDGGWPNTATRFSSPTLYNFTFIGSRRAQPGITLRDSMGGFFANGIVTNDSIRCLHRTIHNEAGNVQAIGAMAQTLGSGLEMKSLILWPRNPATWATAVVPADDSTYYKANKCRIIDPLLREVVRGGNKIQPLFDPRPSARAGSPALDPAFITALPVGDPFFTTANYIGAFSPTDLWIRKWTAVDQKGILSPILEVSPGLTTKLHSQQPVKFEYWLKMPGWTIQTGSASFKMTMDGVDVKSTFISKVRNLPLVDGGVVYYADFLTAASMIPPGKPVVGDHVLKGELPIAGTNEVLKSEWEFTIVQ